MMMSSSVEEYVAKQPSLAWRRRWFRAFIRFVGYKLMWHADVTGNENIPDGGPAIIMMNHISSLDPILCMGAITNRFVIPMTKIENVENPFIRPFVWWWGAYAVHRGEIDRKALTNSIELLKSGQLILIAPEGTRQKNGLARPKDGLAYIATKANSVIIPTAISGAMDWTEKLKNRQRPQIKINFGPAFRFKTGDKSRVPREDLTTMTEEAMYQLALALKDESQRGVYSDVSQATTQFLEFLR